MTIYGTELPIPCPAGETAKRSGSKRLSACLKYRVATATQENGHFALSPPFHSWCVAVNQLISPYTITWPTHIGTTSEPRADLSLDSFKVASSDAHMETPESQAQDTLIINGAAEASTSSPPASPPPAVLSALSELSTTAEQGKDGRRFVVASSCFRSPMSDFFLQQALLLSVAQLYLPKSSAQSKSIKDLWSRIAPLLELVKHSHHRRLQK
jgi:hypothetical protein